MCVNTVYTYLKIHNLLNVEYIKYIICFYYIKYINVERCVQVCVFKYACVCVCVDSYIKCRSKKCKKLSEIKVLYLYNVLQHKEVKTRYAHFKGNPWSNDKSTFHIYGQQPLFHIKIKRLLQNIRGKGISKWGSLFMSLYFILLFLFF